MELPESVQETILGDPRIGALLGMVDSMPAGDNITLGFDSAGLAEQMSGVLEAMTGTDAGLAPAGKITIELFPADSSGQRLTPSNFAGIAVLSGHDQISGSGLQSVIFDEDGEGIAASVQTPLFAIPKNSAKKKSFESTEQWDVFVAESDALQKQVRKQDQSGLANTYLVTAAALRNYPDLENLAKPVNPYLLTSNLPSSLQAVAQQVFDNSSLNSIKLQVNSNAFDATMSANESGAKGVISFGISRIVTSPLPGDLNAIFLRGLFPEALIGSKLLAEVVRKNALRKWDVDNQAALIAKVSAGMGEVIGAPAVAEMSDDKIMELV